MCTDSPADVVPVRWHPVLLPLWHSLTCPFYCPLHPGEVPHCHPDHSNSSVQGEGVVCAGTPFTGHWTLGIGPSDLLRLPEPLNSLDHSSSVGSKADCLPEWLHGQGSCRAQGTWTQAAGSSMEGKWFSPLHFIPCLLKRFRLHQNTSSSLRFLRTFLRMTGALCVWLKVDFNQCLKKKMNKGKF